MELWHFSEHANPIGLLRKTQRDSSDYKPIAFWVSDESDFGWSDWCKEEHSFLNTLAYRRRVTLDMANPRVKVIRTSIAMRKFHELYSVGMSTSAWPDPLVDCRLIQWRRVAEDYDALIITPYLRQLRDSLQMECWWYYSWDCASGAIWHPRVVTGIGPPEPFHLTAAGVPHRDELPF